MYLERHLAVILRRMAHDEELLCLEGPRGAGKSTLLAKEFPTYAQVSLKDATDRRNARSDPRQFLLRLRRAAVIDEVHRAPELVEYLRERPSGLRLIIASSIRLALPIPTLELHPATVAERQRRSALPIEMIGRFAPAPLSRSTEAAAWPETDLEMSVPVRDFDLILAFAEKARAASGEGLHQHDLARAVGVSHRTAVRWLAALEACMLILRIDPIPKDFGRRTVKRPKLHFLSGARNFESQVVGELYKNARHAGLTPQLGYWRDSNGLEIPLVLEQDGNWTGVGISKTPTPAGEANLQRWMQLTGSAKAAMISQSLPRMARRDPRVLRYEYGQL